MKKLLTITPFLLFVCTSAFAQTTKPTESIVITVNPDQDASFALKKPGFPVLAVISMTAIAENNNGHVTTTPAGANMFSIVFDQPNGHSSVNRRCTSCLFVDFGGTGDWAASVKPDPNDPSRIIVHPITGAVGNASFDPQFVTSGPITYHISLWY